MTLQTVLCGLLLLGSSAFAADTATTVTQTKEDKTVSYEKSLNNYAKKPRDVKTKLQDTNQERQKQLNELDKKLEIAD
jgi:hypothetical protein